jgi:hypothetical protein
MPGQGVSSTFTFGTGYGQIQGLLGGLGIPFLKRQGNRADMLSETGQ